MPPDETEELIKETQVMRCKACGQVYPIVPHFKAAASHGPNRDCNGREWEPVIERVKVRRVI